MSVLSSRSREDFVSEIFRGLGSQPCDCPNVSEKVKWVPYTKTRVESELKRSRQNFIFSFRFQGRIEK